MCAGRVKVWRIASLSEAARIAIYSPDPDPTPPALVNVMKQLSNNAIFLGQYCCFPLKYLYMY